MTRQDRLLAGCISKPHGTGGSILVRLNGDFADLFNIGEPLFLEIQGTLVPFFIEEAEEFSNKVIMKLEFIDSIEQAATFSGCNVYLDMPEFELPDPGIKSLIGYKISDELSGISGVIVGITGPPMNPLFEVRSEKKDYLIPVQPDLITRIDHALKCIELKLPGGFSEI